MGVVPTIYSRRRIRRSARRPKLALINQLDRDATVPAGTRLKRVVR